MEFKVDLHIHSSEDLNHMLNCSAKDIIDYRKKQGFNVLSFTLHDAIFNDSIIHNYALQKDMCLIPGIELTIINDFCNDIVHHVLLYNCFDLISFYADLFVKCEKVYRLKRNLFLSELLIYLNNHKNDNLHNFIIIPHPFYKLNHHFESIRVLVDKLKNYIVALEYCHFYTSFFNYHNKKMLKCAQKNNISIIASSDAHTKFQLNYVNNYTLVNLYNFDEFDCAFSQDRFIFELFKSIRENNITIVTKKLPVITYFRIFFYSIKGFIKIVIRTIF